MASRFSSSSANGHIPQPADAANIPSTTPVTRNASTLRGESPPHFDWNSQANKKAETLPYDPSLLPSGSRSLAAIGLQAFWLGFSFAFCSCATAWSVWIKESWWRLPAFFGCLSGFHFLEYYITARFNLPAVRKDSFLLFNNGIAYNVAHSLATLEIIVSIFIPQYQALGVNQYTVIVGLVLIFVGQTVRSVAMAQAGTNFNHTPAKTRREGHELVTLGIYGWLRHPSYFGFFWWALGTQLLAGNKVCLVGYAVVLWRFFYYRIIAEERTLVQFFGNDYQEYRMRTMVAIPFIR